MAFRTGTIYVEHGFRRRVRGVGFVARDRWCGEITVAGKRFRCRSASERCVRAWLDDMLTKFPTYVGGRAGKIEGYKYTRAGKYPTENT